MVSPTSIPILGAIFRRASLAIQWRIDEKVGPLDGRLHELAERVDRLEHRAGLADRRLDDELRFVVDEVQCIGPQVASLEQRMADARGSAPPPSPDMVDAETEHRRARVRLSAVSSFEERLSRLESSTAGVRGTEGGDVQ